MWESSEMKVYRDPGAKCQKDGASMVFQVFGIGRTLREAFILPNGERDRTWPGVLSSGF